MDQTEVIWVLVILALLYGLVPGGPSRFSRVRGAPSWTDQPDAQRGHLNHYARPTQARNDEEDD